MPGKRGNSKTTNNHNNAASSIVELTASVVAAYVAKNPIATSEIPKLIDEVHAKLEDLTAGNIPLSQHNTKPAVPISKSLHEEYIICLEDGKKFKSLKRHLKVHYQLTPQQYREKWGLPADYPMTAPAYSAARSKLAKDMKLGRKRGTKIKKTV